LFSAVDGVEPQSETNWRLADNYKVPRIAFVNKMDRAGSDFFSVVNDVKIKLGSNAIPLQVPIGAEENFKGVVDLITNEAIVWNEHDMGMTYNVIPIPADLVETVAEYREKLLEAVAEYDETLMEKFFDDPNSISPDEMRAAIRAAVCDMKFVPMMCGSSFKNKGVQAVLTRFAPSCLPRWMWTPLKVLTRKRMRRKSAGLRSTSLLLRWLSKLPPTPSSAASLLCGCTLARWTPAPTC
jgi:elongation factor G